MVCQILGGHCQQWAEGKLLHDVDLLIHLTLADPTLWSARSLENMIPHPTVEIRKAVAENIMERGGKGCCFILDGWEDLPEEIHTSFVIHDLLKGSQPGVALPHCSFIITTRPIASPSLQPLITTTVEITGFSAESVDTYASQYLTQQGKDPAVFITALNDNHHARGLCSLPINAAILLHLFLTIQTGLPTTQTELFKRFILNLLLRHLVTKAGQKHKPSLRFFSNLPPNEKLAFNNLCLVAYHSTFSGKVASQSNQLVSSDDLHKAGLQDLQETLGLMKVHQQLTWCGYDPHYGFLHSSVQDFLCAKRMSQLSPQEQVRDFIRIMTSNPTSLVLRFYAGITKLDNDKVSEYLYQIGMSPPEFGSTDHLFTTSSDPRRLFLTYLHCLYEAKCHTTVFESRLSQVEIAFCYYRLSVHDLNVIWYFILDMTRKFFPKVVDFNFTACHLNDHGIESAVTTLAKRASSYCPSISNGFFELMFSDNIGYNGVRSLAKVIAMENVNLTGLSLILQRIEFRSLIVLIEALSSSKIVRLRLRAMTAMTSRHVYHLILLVNQARNLVLLDLSANLRLAEYVPLLLIATKNVHILHIGDMIRDKQLLEMGPILQSNTTLKYLDIASVFLRNLYSLESLCKFIEMIMAPESSLRLQHLVTDYTDSIELKTTIKKFCGYHLTVSSSRRDTEKWLKSLKSVCSLPESLITGRT